MFCVKCGHPIDDGNAFCANCGAAIENASSEEVQTVSPLDTQPENTARKKNKSLLLLICAGVVALAAIVALLLNFGGLKNWFVRSVSTPEDLMATAYKTAAAQALAPAMESYGSSFKAIQDGKYASSGQIAFKPGQQILDMLSYAVYGGEGDMSWLSDIRLGVDYALEGGLQKNVLGIGLGENAIASVELITDAENSRQYIRVPELNEQALWMDMSQGEDLSSVDMSKLYEAMPSAETVGQLVGRYMDILLSGFSSVEKKSETLSLDGISQDVTVLEAYIDHADMIETAIAFLEQLKQDPDIKAVLVDLNPWFNDMMKQSMSSYYDYAESEYEPQDLYTEFTAQIDASLAQLREELSNADPENHLYLYTYLDEDNNIVGVKLSISGMEETVSCMTLTQAGQFSTEMILGGLQIKGSGVEQSSLSGSYAVMVENEKILDITLENVTEASGVICLEPSAVFLADVAEEMGLDAGMVSMADIMLRISTESTAQNSHYTVSVLSNEVSIVELEISGEVTEVGEILLPADALDANDEEAAFNWLMGLDLEDVMGKLQEAGVPEELFAALLQG